MLEYDVLVYDILVVVLRRLFLVAAGAGYGTPSNHARTILLLFFHYSTPSITSTKKVLVEGHSEAVASVEQRNRVDCSFPLWRALLSSTLSSEASISQKRNRRSD